MAAVLRADGEMNFKRLLKHMLLPPWLAQRHFTEAVLQNIEHAVRQSERRHNGELRVVVEACLEPRALWRDQPPRARAGELFVQLHVWDTAGNSGVLLYVNCADRDIEIVADRGISARVSQAEWESICRGIEQAFRAQRFEAGLLDGIAQISALLERHFPVTDADNPDELENRPLLL